MVSKTNAMVYSTVVPNPALKSFSAGFADPKLPFGVRTAEVAINCQVILTWDVPP